MPVGTSSLLGSGNRLAQAGSTHASGSGQDTAAPGSQGGQTTAAARKISPRAPSSATVTVSGADDRGNLNSDAGPATITVANSADLGALAEAITLANLGENITVTGSQFTSRPGGINIDAGTIFERTLALSQSTFAADVIKARSFNTGARDALVIDSSSFDATRLIRFYAEGDSRLLFRGNVDLKSPRSQFAGRIVEVERGGRVTSDGSVDIYSDDHRYNNGSNGTITGKDGAPARHSYSSKPRY